MKKKIICSFLIFSILLHSACTTLETVQKDEIDNSIIEKNIVVILKDSTEYKIGKNDFSISEDTIFLYKKKYHTWEKDDTLKVPLKDISEIKIEQLDTEKTVMYAIVIAVIFIGIIALSFLGDTLPGNMSSN